MLLEVKQSLLRELGALCVGEAEVLLTPVGGEGVAQILKWVAA